MRKKRIVSSKSFLGFNMNLDKFECEWQEMYRRCFVTLWNWGVLQPEYVYFSTPVVIIDDTNWS